MFVQWGRVSSEGWAQVSIAISLWARPKSICPSRCVGQRRRTRQELGAGAEGGELPGFMHSTLCSSSECGWDCN